MIKYGSYAHITTCTIMYIRTAHAPSIHSGFQPNYSHLKPQYTHRLLRRGATSIELCRGVQGFKCSSVFTSSRVQRFTSSRVVLRVKPLLNEEVELGRQPSRPRGLYSMVHEVTARRSLQRGVHEEYDKESLRVVTSHRITGRSQRGRDKGGRGRGEARHEAKVWYNG